MTHNPSTTLLATLLTHRHNPDDLPTIITTWLTNHPTGNTAEIINDLANLALQYTQLTHQLGHTSPAADNITTALALALTTTNPTEHTVILASPDTLKNPAALTEIHATLTQGTNPADRAWTTNNTTNPGPTIQLAGTGITPRTIQLTAPTPTRTLNKLTQQLRDLT